MTQTQFKTLENYLNGTVPIHHLMKTIQEIVDAGPPKTSTREFRNCMDPGWTALDLD